MDPVARFALMMAGLDSDAGRLDRLHRYYRGRSDLPVLPAQASPDLQRLARVARSRWGGAIVDSVADRLAVDGAKSSSGEDIDRLLWGWWQSSSMDARQDATHIDAMTYGETFVLVWPGGGGPPRIRGLDRRDTCGTLAGTDPAALADAATRWTAGGTAMGALYDRDAAYMFAAAPEGRSVPVHRWWREEPDHVEVWPGDGWQLIDAFEHGMGACPVVRFANVPDLRGQGLSDIDDHADAIDRIVEDTMGRLTAGKFGAFRQRWATGLQLGSRIDPKTGEPVLGPDGRPLPAGAPFRYGADLLWTSEDPDAKFGDFAATDLRPIIEAIDQDIKHLAALSNTPAHYFMAGTANPPSAEALIAAQDGLMAKTRRRQLHFGEAWESVLRLAARAAGIGDAAQDDALQVVWRGTEVRSPGAVADAFVKLRQGGMPLTAVLEWAGYSPQSIARILADAAAEQAQQARSQATAFGA